MVVSLIKKKKKKKKKKNFLKKKKKKKKHENATGHFNFLKIFEMHVNADTI